MDVTAQKEEETSITSTSMEMPTASMATALGKQLTSILLAAMLTQMIQMIQIIQMIQMIKMMAQDSLYLAIKLSASTAV